MVLRFNWVSVRCLAVIGVLAGACMADSTFADTSYNAIYLGGGGLQTQGNAINNNGEVTGFIIDFDQNQRAFRYADGAMTLIPTLGGAYNIGNGINSDGRIVGFSSTGSAGRGFIYDPSSQSATSIGVLPGGTHNGGYSVAHDINDEGYVVGGSYYRSADWAEHAVLYDPYTQQLTSLGALGSDEVSVARVINNDNQIAGGSLASIATNAERLFFYDNGVMKDVHAIAIGELGLTGVFSTMAKDINDDGEVLGTAFIGDSISDASGYFTSFIYYGNSPFDAVEGISNTLGGYSTNAMGLNSDGKVVGNSWDGSSNTAFVYDLYAGAMTDLNTLVDLPNGWHLTGATAINDMGQIVATATRGDEYRTFLLSAVTDRTSPVTPGSDGGWATVAVNGGNGVVGGVSAEFYESTGTFSADYSLNVASELELQTATFTFTLAGDGNGVQAWELFFDGSTVGVPARITLTYDETLLAPGTDESLLAIYHFTSDQWVLVDNLIVEVDANTISFDTSSFSPFVLGFVPEPGTLALLATSSLALMRRRR